MAAQAPFTGCLETICWDNPSKAGTQMLADELAQMPASLNHHLARLVETGLIGFTNEGKGWRKYYLRGGSLSNAVAYVQQHSTLLLQQRFDTVATRWQRSGESLPVELPQDETPPFSIGLVDHRPLQNDGEGDVLSHWMNDFGLLGERPGAEIAADSLSVRLFATLLNVMHRFPSMKRPKCTAVRKRGWKNPRPIQSDRDGGTGAKNRSPEHRVVDRDDDAAPTPWRRLDAQERRFPALAQRTTTIWIAKGPRKGFLERRPCR